MNWQSTHQVLAHVLDGGLGGIVRRLQLGKVGNMARHARSRDKAASPEILELVLLLLAPDPTNDSGAVEQSIHVDFHDAVVVVKAASDGCAALWTVSIACQDWRVRGPVLGLNP